MLGQTEAAEEDAQPPEALASWDAAIVSNEVRLLQYHVSKCLKAMATSPQPLSGQLRQSAVGDSVHMLEPVSG